MDLTFKKVATEELPKVLEWLEKHLPESWRMYGLVREHVMGRWAGHSFLVLGWPENPQAVVEGDLDLAVHPCPEYYYNPRVVCVFATCEYAEIALSILDWSQNIVIFGLPYECEGPLKSVAKKFACTITSFRVNALMVADAEDLKEFPLPEDLTLRPLSQKSDIDYALSTWWNTRQNTDKYFAALIKHFPSVGLFDREGVCHGLEMGREFGFTGILYVREESRRRGLGQVIATRLAQKYFEQGLPAVTLVKVGNKSSEELHKKIGFKTQCLIITAAAEKCKDERN